MKKRIFLSVIFLVLIVGGLYLNQLMPVITGYAAKNLASGVFVAGRTQEAMEAEDLNFSVIKYTANTVDFEKKEVVSRFLWGKSKAVYIDGYGCTLVADYPEEAIRSRSYPQVVPLPENPDTIDWPMGNVVADSVPRGINPDKLQEAVNKVMSDTIPYKGTFALMVVYRGQPVAEAYRDDFAPESRFLSWSMAKSFTNALIGLRVKEGQLRLDQPLDFDDREPDQQKDIVLNNLLQMNSGLEWNENYGNLSDVTIMLHKAGDMGIYAARKPAAFPAGSVWLYSSGTSNLASLILRRSFPDDEAYYRFPREALFNKTGMKSVVFELDASGTFVGSSYLYATMRDYARFGLLYLNRGNWLGEQLLPEGWVDYTVQPAEGSDGQYGAFFWLNRSGDQPDAPEDTYMCKGHDGQFIFIIPSKELIVVRTGFSKKGEFDTNLMLKEILASLDN
ncbi:serine hydrolase domain-containing protein [Gaoshiqia sp. Z1-71]|uniref:serine hydrolase domain-containing protein n=1 Tax=Gaoshiqia hydrogeniformans TaxID=3290090 RepID=UPI003BF89B14